MMGRPIRTAIPSRSSSIFAAEERENLRVAEAQAAVEKLEAAEKAWLRLGSGILSSLPQNSRRKPRQVLM